MSRALRGALLLAGLSLAGCSDLGKIFGNEGEDDTGGDGGGGDASSMLSRDSSTMKSDGNGIISVPVELVDGESAFSITVEGKNYPAVERVLDPDGNEVLYWEDWYYSDQSLTSAVWLEGKQMAFNWPVRAEDGPLATGTWTVEVGLVDNSGYYATREEAQVTILKKRDRAFDEGEVRVRILWAEGVGSDPDVVAAIESAVERWREVWGARGLTLVESYHDSALDPDLAFAWSGSNDVESAAEAYDGRELLLVVGETIDGGLDTYGVAGGIPGSIEPTKTTFVVLSWLAHAGGNGKFDEDEIRLMGETAAHECGHFMGLFHPVEDGYDSWDALSDTPDCTNWQTCENKLGDNLMFPYPVCDWEECYPQGELTDGQVGVSQRYIGSL